MTRNANDIAMDMDPTSDTALDIMAPDAQVPVQVGEGYDDEEDGGPASCDESDSDEHDDSDPDVGAISYPTNHHAPAFTDFRPATPPAPVHRPPPMHHRARERVRSRDVSSDDDRRDQERALMRRLDSVALRPTPTQGAAYPSVPVQPGEFIDRAWEDLRQIGDALERLSSDRGGSRLNVAGFLQINEMQNAMFMQSGSDGQPNFQTSTKAIYMQIHSLAMITKMIMEHVEVVPAPARAPVAQQPPVIVNDTIKTPDGKQYKVTAVTDSEAEPSNRKPPRHRRANEIRQKDEAAQPLQPPKQTEPAPARSNAPAQTTTSMQAPAPRAISSHPYQQGQKMHGRSVAHTSGVPPMQPPSGGIFSSLFS